MATVCSVRYPCPPTRPTTAFVFEDDCNVTVRLEAVRADGSAASVEVESSRFGELLEFGSSRCSAGVRALVLRLDGGQDWDSPCHARTRVVSYQSARSDAHIEARLTALRAWTAATRAGGTPQDLQRTGQRGHGRGAGAFLICRWPTPGSRPGPAGKRGTAQYVRRRFAEGRRRMPRAPPRNLPRSVRRATRHAASSVRMAILTDIAHRQDGPGPDG